VRRTSRHIVPAALGGVLLIASFAAAGGDASPEPEPADERPAQATIDGAVERGIAWLRREQKRDGSFGQGPGETALSLLTLRHSGVAADDRACKRAARYLERDLPDGTVYGAALGALSLLSQNPVLHQSKIEELVSDLVAAQCKNGQWTYAYRATARKKSGDNSNTQFALLAMASARSQGFDVPSEPVAKAAEFLRATQNEDGGFGYSDKERSRSYASMTAGAAMCLAFANSFERGATMGVVVTQDDVALRKTLEWLAEHFDEKSNFGAGRSFGGSNRDTKKKKRSDAFWRHYWLWSAERAAAAAGQTRFGEHDWYGAGCRILLERQKKDGQWRDPEREILATCFALLFFRRSTHIAITPSDRVRPAVTPSSK